MIELEIQIRKANNGWIIKFDDLYGGIFVAKNKNQLLDIMLDQLQIKINE